VCDRLGELREAMARYAAGFEAALLADPLAVVRQAAAVESIAATVKALAAARASDIGTWRRGAHRSAAEELAAATGSSVGAARDTIKTGERLEGQPEVAAAARSGELSAAQASMITQAAAANPQAQLGLLECAKTGSLGELRNHCAEVIAAADRHPDDRRRRIHKGRRLKVWNDLEGVAHLVARGNPEDIAQVMAAVEPLRDELFGAARREGRREAPEAYAFDALVALARRGPKAGSGRAKIIVRVDLGALLRGYPLEEENCEIVGYGPVAPSAVLDLIDTGDPFLAAVATKGEKLLGVVHLGRRPRAAQQTALEWLYPACAVRGCSTQAFLQADHRLDWSKVHITVLDLLDRLCRHHHGLKTNEGWALVAGRGKRDFVPPDDARHPRHHPEGQRVRC
jgi:hypothetical protein